MTKFYKHAFKSRTADGLEERNGYKFDYLLGDGTMVQLGMYKTEGRHGVWNVIDLDCGLMICSGAKREDAVRKAEELREKYQGIRETPKYKQGVNEFYALLAEAEKPKETEIKVTTARIIPTHEGVKAEVIEEHTEKVAAKPKASKPKKQPEKQPEKMATVTALDTLRKAFESAPSADAIYALLMERFKDEPNTAVTQKRPGCAAWVEGVTKPYQDELRGLGMRWSKSRKGWYFGEKEAAKKSA